MKLEARNTKSEALREFFIFRISIVGIRALGRTTAGFSTLEALIAIAVLTLSISASSMLVFGSQSLAVDTSTHSDALTLGETMLEGARANAAASFGSVLTTPPATANGYTSSLSVNDNGLCEKWATGTIAWNGGRPQTISLTTDLSDPALALALGSDCGAPPGGSPPGGGGGCPTCPTWQKPRLFASYTFHPGQPVSLDVLDGVAYVTDNKHKLNIVDTSSATLGLSGNFLSPPYDGGQLLNDVDAVKWHDPVTGAEKRYAYVARGNSGIATSQFQVIDVTDSTTPLLTASRTLGGAVPPSGSHPEGWRVFSFGNRVYITTRETLGYEFHIFNVTDPTNPSEVGPGLQLNGTSNDMVVAGMMVNGILHRAVFLATDRSHKELMVVDVTESDPTTPKLVASIDLGTTNNALSIYLVGNRLYLGRQNTAGGPELYVYDVAYGDDGTLQHHLTVTLRELGTAEIGADVKAIRVFNTFAFLATSLANDEFQVWDTSQPSVSILRRDASPLHLPNKIVGGMDYEDPYMYLGSQAANPLEILYSAP